MRFMCVLYMLFLQIKINYFGADTVYFESMVSMVSVSITLISEEVLENNYKMLFYV